MSDEYDRVFPMDIYPEYLIKAILAFDIDKMENLGIYEVAPEDFALCEFVDTSKLEVQKIVRDGLDRLMKEMTNSVTTLIQNNLESFKELYRQNQASF